MSIAENDLFERECLQAHNQFRAEHGVPPLLLSKKLTDHAQKWAETIACRDEVRHSSNNHYGENIFMCRGIEASGDTAVKAWYFEIKDYNFAHAKFTPRSGHFTQVIWRNSKELGVGIARKGNASYVVAAYYPPGNIQGEFKENVPQKIQKKPTATSKISNFFRTVMKTNSDA